MEPVVKRLIALVVINIVLLAVFLSKNKDKESATNPVVTEQVSAANLSSANADEDKVVNDLLENGSISDLEKYIKNHPDSPSIIKLRGRLSELNYQKLHPGGTQSNAANPTKPLSTGNRVSTTTTSARTTTTTTTKPKAEPEQRRTLSNGSQPYAAWYGYNQRYSSNEPQSTIQVTSAVSQDVIVIVKYNNQDGRVAGHLYIQAGRTGKIYVTPGYRYQVFFYYGDDWDENKQMPGGVRGGFTRHEQADKDPNSHYFAINETYDGITWDGGMEYNLNPTYSGNFNTKKSSVSEVF